MCIQETKKENFNKLICQSLWGDSTASWDSVPSVQTSGGLLCMWNNSVFEVDRKQESVVIKPVDYGESMYEHNIRSRMSSMGYGYRY